MQCTREQVVLQHPRPGSQQVACGPNLALCPFLVGPLLTLKYIETQRATFGVHLALGHVSLNRLWLFIACLRNWFRTPCLRAQNSFSNSSLWSKSSLQTIIVYFLANFKIYRNKQGNGIQSFIWPSTSVVKLSLAPHGPSGMKMKLRTPAVVFFENHSTYCLMFMLNQKF